MLLIGDLPSFVSRQETVVLSANVGGFGVRLVSAESALPWLDSDLADLARLMETGSKSRAHGAPASDRLAKCI